MKLGPTNMAISADANKGYVFMGVCVSGNIQYKAKKRNIFFAFPESAQ